MALAWYKLYEKRWFTIKNKFVLNFFKQIYPISKDSIDKSIFISNSLKKYTWIFCVPKIHFICLLCRVELSITVLRDKTEVFAHIFETSSTGVNSDQHSNMERRKCQYPKKKLQPFFNKSEKRNRNEWLL